MTEQGVVGRTSKALPIVVAALYIAGVVASSVVTIYTAIADS